MTEESKLIREKASIAVLAALATKGNFGHQIEANEAADMAVKYGNALALRLENELDEDQKKINKRMDELNDFGDGVEFNETHLPKYKKRD